MPVALCHLREQLLPGLMAIQYSFAQTKETLAADIFNTPAAPELTTKETVALGIAAIIANNPVVSRRFLPDWT